VWTWCAISPISNFTSSQVQMPEITAFSTFGWYAVLQRLKYVPITLYQHQFINSGFIIEILGPLVRWTLCIFLLFVSQSSNWELSNRFPHQSSVFNACLSFLTLLHLTTPKMVGKPYKLWSSSPFPNYLITHRSKYVPEYFDFKHLQCIFSITAL
jgi:hypothetical protein